MKTFSKKLDSHLKFCNLSKRPKIFEHLPKYVQKKTQPNDQNLFFQNGLKIFTRIF